MSHAFSLSLDCSLEGFSLALQHGDALVQHTDNGPHHADALHTTLYALLDEHGLDLVNLARLVATVGPGSFTGIRVGVAVGEALRLIYPNLALVGVGTLEALALNLIRHQAVGEPFTILTNAAGGSVYAQTFNADATPKATPVCVPLAEFQPSTPVLAPASLMLTLPHTPLPAFSPSVLFALADSGRTHPLAPMYVKELAYKPSAGVV